MSDTGMVLGRWFAALTLIAGGAQANDTIIPRPAQLKERAGAFALRGDSVLVADAESLDEARKLADALAPATGFDLRVVEGRPHRLRRGLGLCRGGARDTSACRTWIHLRKTRGLRRLGDESYVMRVRSGAIRIRARAEVGLFYATQTLRQLLPPEIFSPAPVAAEWSVPAVHIKDWPRFAWRGMHLDVARHFIPADEVKRILDAMALHKLNRLHWHLTDDQGWRIEIQQHPALTQVGAWRTSSPVRHLSEAGLLNLFLQLVPDGIPHGGFYTQEEIREVVAHAAERHITVVPEIDLPGHITSAIAAIPSLGNTGLPIDVATIYGIHTTILNVEETTFAFLEDVFSEVMGLFPSPIIHLGGDEVPFVEWQASASAQATMAELGFTQADELLGWFINRVAEFIRSQGRRPAGWQNGLYKQGLVDEDVILTEWLSQGVALDLAQAGREVVMAPLGSTYFDHPWLPLDPNQQTELESALGANNPLLGILATDLAEVYGFDPLGEDPSPEQETHVLGAQGQIWSEFILDGADAERFAFPRLTALAEVVWTPPERKDFADFERRLDTHLQRLQALGVQFLRR